MSYLSSAAGGGTLLFLYVQPRASKTKISGIHDGRLKLAVAGPPVEGKANKEVVKFLAGLLGVAARNLVLKSGAHGRKKVVAIENMDVDEVRVVLEQHLCS